MGIRDWIRPKRATPKRRRVPNPVAQKIAYDAHGSHVENMSRGYESVQKERSSGRVLATVGGSGDYHLHDDLEDMRAISQEFYRTNPIFRAVIHRMWDFILGSGTILQPRTRSKRVNAYLVDAWGDFWRSPELRGWHKGPGIEWLMGMQLARDGDIGVFRHERSGKIQLVSADRIRSIRTQADNGNRIEQGVELSRSGTISGFHVADFDRQGLVRLDSRRVSARYMHLMANREDSDQTRGVPMLQCNFAMLRRIKDVCDSEAAAWQLLSRLAVAVTREQGQEEAAAQSVDDPNASDADLAQRYHDITDVAVEFHGTPGDKIEGVGRNIPGGNFTDSIKMFLRLLGMAFGLPLEFMLLIWSDTNYSSGRAAKMQMGRACLPWWRLFKDDGIGPVYRWKVGRWLRKGKVAERSDLFDHDFHVIPYPSMDPLKDEAGRIMKYKSGMTSPSIEAAEMGYPSLNQLLDIQQRDIEEILERVDKINGAHPNANLTLADFTGFIQAGKGDDRAMPKRA